MVQYRWHPLYGQRVRRIRGERRASGELVHVELTPGAAVAILPAWKLDAVYCAGLKVGPPQVSLAALCSLHELLIACESRLVSADGNIVTQEAQDGSAVTAGTKDGACLQAHKPDGTTPARTRSRRRAISGHDAGGAPSLLRAMARLPCTKSVGLKISRVEGFSIALLTQAHRLFRFLAGDHYGKGKSIRDER